MGAVSARDVAAFEELYERYAPSLMALARKVVARSDLAEEVVQATFLAVWRDAARYDPHRGALSTWLLTLCHHKAIDLVRREDKHRRRRAGHEHLDDTTDDGLGPDELAVAADQCDRVRTALARLDPRQGTTSKLAYYGGFTLREVGILMHVPEGTAKSRARAGLCRLRTMLSEEVEPAVVPARIVDVTVAAEAALSR
jgi:RNA polymerase sigma-70 factor (ECF subfamily)